MKRQGNYKRSPIPLKARLAFKDHRRTARSRGIPFLFSRPEWLLWWEHNLGPDWMTKRGNTRGQYVMARLKDEGPYAPSNVKCIRAEENVRECSLNGKNAVGERAGTAKFTNEFVAEVYKLTKIKGPTEIARLLGVKYCFVEAVKNKRTWRTVTDLVDATFV